MANFIAAKVFATPEGGLSTSANYLFGVAQIVNIKEANAKITAAYPAVKSVIRVNSPQNNASYDGTYLVAETLTTLNS